MKYKLNLAIGMISVIVLFSGCIKTFTHEEGECPTIYGFDISKKDSTNGSSYVNLTHADFSTIPEILAMMNELVQNQTLKSKDIRLEYERWNVIKEILTDDIFYTLGTNSWYFRFNEQFFEFFSYVMVC